MAFHIDDPRAQAVAARALSAGFKPDEVAAGVERYKRQRRLSHPAGDFDRAGRFHIGEGCACCRAVRAPSRAHPYSEMDHGRTIGHVATLYGVGEGAVRRVSDALEAAGRRNPGWIDAKLRKGALAAAKARLAAAATAHERMVALAELAAISPRAASAAGRAA